MKPPTLIAWENVPTGGVSSGEVIAVLLMANCCVQWSRSPCGDKHRCSSGPPPPGAGAPDPTRAHRPRSVSSSEPRDRQSAEFESHEASGFPKLPALCNGEPTIPQVHYSHHDIAVSARFCYSLGGRFRSTLGGSLAR